MSFNHIAKPEKVTLAEKAGNEIALICAKLGIHKAVVQVFASEEYNLALNSAADVNREFNTEVIASEPPKDLALDVKKTNYWKIAAIVLAVVAVVALVVAAAFATAGFGIIPVALTMTQVIAGTAGSGAITLLSGAGAIYSAYRASKA